MPAKAALKIPQHRYVALLRAINVGGHAIVKMDDLRKLFEGLGFQNVQTYIQSGNVLFSSWESDPGKLARAIEKRIESVLGHQLTVFMFSPEELKEAAAHNPFEPERLEKEQHCQLLFLSAKPNPERRKTVMALQGKEYRFHLHGKVLYYAYSRKLAGNRRSVNFEKVLDVAATGRTWRVINKLIELAENRAGA
jgi:uncharacterized protein (DUF1697 family)